MENLIITNTKIHIPKDPDCKDCEDKVIMDERARLYEEKIGELVGTKGGNILEIGFGLGISANKIQSYEIDSHVIIEKRKEIYDKAIEWAEDKENVTIHLGDWIHILPQLNDAFDAIYNDADEDSKDKLSNFPEICKRLAKNKCVLYMTNWGNEFLERALPYHTLENDENLQELFGDETTSIPYSTYKNSDWS